MENKTSTVDLVQQLSAISTQIDNLEMKKMQLEQQYNEIILELWNRFPPLKKNPDMQPIGKVKKIGKYKGE